MFYIEVLFKCSFFSVICSICSGTVSRRGSPGLKASNLKIWVTNLTVSISFNITFINICHWNIKNSHLNFKIPVTCKILKLSELTLHNFLSILAEKWWPKFFCKLLGRPPSPTPPPSHLRHFSKHFSFLQPVNGSKNSILNWVMKLNLFSFLFWKHPWKIFHSILVFFLLFGFDTYKHI